MSWLHDVEDAHGEWGHLDYDPVRPTTRAQALTDLGYERRPPPIQPPPTPKPYDPADDPWMD